jgi:hypothetical protein
MVCRPELGIPRQEESRVWSQEMGAGLPGEEGRLISGGAEDIANNRGSSLRGCSLTEDG